MRVYQGGPAKWTQEKGYRRGVLFPFGGGLLDDVQTQLTEIDPQRDLPVPPHYHLKQYELIFMLEGELEYFSCDFVLEGEFLNCSDERSEIVKPGDLLLIEPMELHRTTSLISSVSKFLTIKLRGVPNDTVWPKPESIRKAR